MNFRRIGEDWVNKIRPRGLFLTLIRRCEAASIESLCSMNHIDDLFPNVADLAGPVIFRHDLGCTGHGIDLTRFTTTMGLSMKGGEAPHDLTGELHLTTHEYTLPGNKHVIEYEGRTVFAISNVSTIRPFQLTSVQRTPSHDVYKPFRVGRNRKRDSVILILLAKGPGRQHDNLVGA